jgi:hypothetical protein
LNDYVEEKKEMIGFMPLGCGTKPDGVALIRAAKELGIPREKLLYRGVDMAEWNRYGLDYYINDKKDFVQRKADEYFEEIKMLMRDVYVFPKSISELAPKGVYENSPLEKIACSIRDKLHKEKETKFYILVTIRRDKNRSYCVREEDLNSIQNLINTITENGRFTFVKQEQKEGKDIIEIPGNSNLKDTIYFYKVGKPQEENKNIMEDTTYSKYSKYLRNKVDTTLKNYKTKPIIDGDQIREGEDLNKSMMVKYANLGYCILAFEENRKPDKK